MLEDKVVHNLEEAVITVVEEKVTYFNQAAFRLFPQLEKGGEGGFLRKEFPDPTGKITFGKRSITYKKIPNGRKLHFIFSAPVTIVPTIGLSGKEMVGFCQLVAKESEDIFAQLQTVQETTLQHSRIRVHASRLERMANMLHHTMDAQYVEPSAMVDLPLLTEEIKEECAPIFHVLDVSIEVEQPPNPLLFHSKKRELQRIFFLLFSVYGKKGECLKVTFQQSVHKVGVTLFGTMDTEITGLERYCLEELLEGLGGKFQVTEEKGKKRKKKTVEKREQIAIQFQVTQLPAQLQSGNQGMMVPLLPANGMEKVIYIPSAEIFMANRLPEDFFCHKNQEEEKSEA